MNPLCSACPLRFSRTGRHQLVTRGRQDADPAVRIRLGPYHALTKLLKQFRRIACPDNQPAQVRDERKLLVKFKDPALRLFDRLLKG